MRLSKAHFGAQDDPHFDLEVANRIYNWVLDSDIDEVLYPLSIGVFETVSKEMAEHKDEIQGFVDNFYDKRLKAVRANLARQYIDEVANGGDGEEIIAKASSYTEFERRANVRRQQRGPGGRFRVMNRRITYSPGVKPLRGAQAQRSNIPDAKLGDRDKAAFQQAYLQVASALRGMDAVGDDSVTTFWFRDPNTRTMRPESHLGASADALQPDNFKDGVKLEGVEVEVSRDLSVGGAAYDLMGALGAPGPMAAQVVGGARAGMEQFTPFANQWQANEPQPGSDVVNPNARTYRRLGASADLLTAILPDSAMKTKIALRAGGWAGKHGTQVEQVVGPRARKTAYRYRGTERTPDKKLQQWVNNARRRFGGHDEIAREYLVYGFHGPSGVREGLTPVGMQFIDRTGQPQKTHPPDAVMGESPVINYFKGRLASPSLIELQRKSGIIPPSEGVIIARDGTISAQAVGYGEDHYLPFNLKNMSRIKGGEYIRTRAFGGPTTEDVYAGLVSGARAVTVVSNNGVYTVEFDPAFRGSRRYNDKAARMVGRYGKLLDAVQSRKVSLATVDHERQEEIRAGAKRLFPGNVEMQRKHYAQKIEEEIKNPKLTDTAKEEVRQDVLREHFGSDTEVEAGLRKLRLTEAAALTRGGDKPAEGFTPISPQQAMNFAEEMYSDKNLELKELGLATKYQAAIMRREDQLKRDLSPLSLNGKGYDLALQALQEQFPYYITRTHYRPFVESKGGTDKGYIKPRHIRPAGVLAGYYDTSIGGKAQHGANSALLDTGKITADRLYNQNAPYGLNTATAATATPAAAATAATAAAGATAAATPDPLAVNTNRYRSLNNMLTAARAATWASGTGDVRELLVNGDPDTPAIAAKAPNLLGTMDLDALVIKLGGMDETKRVLMREVNDAMRGARQNTMDQRLVARAENDQPEEPVVEYTRALGLNAGQLFKFPEYATTDAPDTYVALADDLLTGTGLPSIISANFTGAINQAMSTERRGLATLQATRERREAGGDTSVADDIEMGFQRLERLVRGQTLHRLWRDAESFRRSEEQRVAAAEAERNRVARGTVEFEGPQDFIDAESGEVTPGTTVRRSIEGGTAEEVPVAGDPVLEYLTEQAQRHYER